MEQRSGAGDSCLRAVTAYAVVKNAVDRSASLTVSGARAARTVVDGAIAVGRKCELVCEFSCFAGSQEAEAGRWRGDKQRTLSQGPVWRGASRGDCCCGVVWKANGSRVGRKSADACWPNVTARPLWLELELVHRRSGPLFPTTHRHSDRALLCHDMDAFTCCRWIDSTT